MKHRETSCAASLFEERYGLLPHQGTLGDLTELLGRFAHLPYENLSKIIAWNSGLATSDPMAPSQIADSKINRANDTETRVTLHQHLPGQAILDRAMRRPVQVMEDHLQLGTGGTCFSLTELLRQLLQMAGFSCYPVMAHMRYGNNIHCALRVNLAIHPWGGKGCSGAAFLVDPGYLVRQPLPLRTSTVAPQALAPGQPLLVPAGSLGPIPPHIPRGDFDLFTVEENGPRWRYRFTDHPPSEDEFLHHWRASFFQPAMHSLFATQRSVEGELMYLHNHKLRRRGSATKVTRNVRADMESTVEQIFGIDRQVTRQAIEIIQSLPHPPSKHSSAEAHDPSCSA